MITGSTESYVVWQKENLRVTDTVERSSEGGSSVSCSQKILLFPASETRSTYVAIWGGKPWDSTITGDPGIPVAGKCWLKAIVEKQPLPTTIDPQSLWRSAVGCWLLLIGGTTKALGFMSLCWDLGQLWVPLRPSPFFNIWAPLRKKT